MRYLAAKVIPQLIKDGHPTRKRECCDLAVVRHACDPQSIIQRHAGSLKNFGVEGVEFFVDHVKYLSENMAWTNKSSKHMSSGYTAPG